MKILVTGAKGFVGKNLCAELNNRNRERVKQQLALDVIFEYDLDTPIENLSSWCSECDFIFHLAGVNRPQHQTEFKEGNVDFTAQVLELLRKHNNKAPILLSSSIHAAKEGQPYGDTKRESEQLLFDYGQAEGVKTYVFRLANLFGKWCRPNYNSVIATFCYNAARGLPLTINDPNAEVPFVYIDDVIDHFIAALTDDLKPGEDGFYRVEPIYPVTIGRLAELLESFVASRTTLELPNLDDGFEKKLYSTYLSYLEPDRFSYNLKMHIDDRGSFTEFLRTPDRGQVSVNIAKPGIVKGNHWHHTKNEKFLVVSGKAAIRFRKIDEDEVIEYVVDGNNLRVVDIPVGYTHQIENIGDTDLVTIMWVNEPFDPDRPDTYFLPV
ncbi:MAG TPA: SDR family oxidoreductase [Clostridiaceae bacterium]|nr:SDR family oxidoreductase [Clostridiaceae bacterium]